MGFNKRKGGAEDAKGKRMAALWAKIDRDGSGSLDEAELEAVLGEQQAEGILSRYDFDGDHLVNREEATAAYEYYEKSGKDGEEDDDDGEEEWYEYEDDDEWGEKDEGEVVAGLDAIAEEMRADIEEGSPLSIRRLSSAAKTAQLVRAVKQAKQSQRMSIT